MRGRAYKRTMKQSNVSKLIAFDPRTKSICRLRGAEITKLDELKYRKYYKYISYLPVKEMQLETIHLDFSVDEKHLAGAIEDMVYEELDLDPDTKYIIRYTHSDRIKNSYQLFIISKEKLDYLFDDTVEEIEYVDNIMPAPLVYDVLYDDLLEPSGVHCFIYFMRDDAFITFYKDGEYIYAKSIKYSLDFIFSEYIKGGGAAMSEESFFELLRAKGKPEESDFTNRIMRIFGETFISLNDVMVYIKRVYNIEKIDRLYIGSSAGNITGLGNFSENFFGLKSLPMRFNFGFHGKSNEIDQFTTMLLERGSKRRLAMDNNFTQHRRPPAMHRRSSGQLVAVMVGASILGLVPTAYHLVSKIAIDGKKGLLLHEEKRIEEDVLKYKKLINSKSTLLERVTQEAKSSQKYLDDKERTLESIYSKKVDYKLKSEQYAMFANDFEKFGIKSYDFHSFNDSYHLFLVAKSDKDITELISFMSKKYDDKMNFIDISIITRDNSNDTYQGLLRMDFK